MVIIHIHIYDSSKNCNNSDDILAVGRLKQSPTTTFQDSLIMLGFDCPGLCASSAIIHDVDVSAGAPVHLRNVTPEAFVTGNFED